MDKRQSAAKKIFDVWPIIQNTFMRRYEMQIDNSLTPLQIQALRMMARNDKLAMNEISSRMHMSKQQLTRFVDGLVRRNLFERVYDDNNRRSIFIRITEEGLNELKIFAEEGIEFFAFQLEELSDEEVGRVEEALATIEEILGKLE